MAQPGNGNYVLNLYNNGNDFGMNSNSPSYVRYPRFTDWEGT